jgi:hypothetical protein
VLAVIRQAVEKSLSISPASINATTVTECTHLPLFARARYGYVPGSPRWASQVANWRGVRTPSSITAVWISRPPT